MTTALMVNAQLGFCAREISEKHLPCSISDNTSTVRGTPSIINKIGGVYSILWRGLKYQDYDFSNKYIISEYGDVQNKNTGIILKPQTNRKGYKFVCISLNKNGGNGQRKIIVIHKAVAYNFVPNLHDYNSVDHIDANKQNNHYSNLEWVTSKENSVRAYKRGLIKPPSKSSNINAKLSDDDVLKIKNMFLVSDMSNSKIGKMFGVSRGTIYQIRKGLIHKDII